MSSYELTPKVALFKVGTLLRVKEEVFAQREPGVTAADTSMPYDDCNTENPAIRIKKGTCVLYLDNRQFYSASKEYQAGMSAWIRAEIMTPLGEKCWITLMQERKTIWDFKTYTGKKNLMNEHVSQTFEVLSVPLDLTQTPNPIEQLITNSVVVEPEPTNKDEQANV